VVRIKPTVVLIDTYSQAADRMADRLRALAAGSYRVVVKPAASRDFTLDAPASLLIVPSSLKNTYTSVSGGPVVLHWGQESAQDDDGLMERVPRFGGARRIDQAIRHHLADQIDPAASGAEPGRRWLGCHLSFSQERSEAITRHVIKKEMAAGRRLIYLPVKPLYLVTDTFRRGPRQTLGDLLCLIASGDLPEAGDLGSWLYLHENGYFAFRLPDRADDMIACETRHLKQLVNLCGAYARTSTEPTVVWLDTAGLPLDKLKSLAILCDQLYVDIPQGDSSAAQMARRELGIFLAALPKSCAILEHPADPTATADPGES
jgi:hypothetical protein